MNAETALAVSWVRTYEIWLGHLFTFVAQIMPSLTPLTNLNSGFRLYEVDSAVSSFSTSSSLRGLNE